MKAGLAKIVVVCMAAACVGCSAPVKIAAGMSALRVRVVAEPKAGYRMPGRVKASGAYGAYRVSSASTSQGRQFERVNYRALEGVVVWIEGESESNVQPASPSASVDVPIESRTLGRSTPPTFVCGVGGSIVFRNRGRSAESVYSFSTGNEFDVGVIAQNDRAVFSPRAPGLIEVLTDSSDDPIAIVYVAPTHHVQRVTSGEAAVFNNVPPGRYRVSCWHPRLPGESADVVLTADQLAETALTVGVNLLAHEP
jgi:hypothetical protein